MPGPAPSKPAVEAWYAAQGTSWTPPARGFASRSDIRAAVGGIDPKAARALSDIICAAHDQHWGASLLAEIRAENTYAALLGDRKSRPVLFTPGRLLDRGVPLETIVAIPAATRVSQGESAKLLRAWDADDRNQAAEEARRAEAARAAAAIDLPDRIDLTKFTPSEVTWLIGGLVPAGKILGLFAERKAGKTTAVVELVRAMLEGDEFVGRFATFLDSDARVALLDTEMGADMMQFECEKASVPDLERLDLYDLRGRSRSLDMRDEATRSRWRNSIAPGSVIIVDCLYTVLSALGIDESSAQVADIIEGLKSLAVECCAAGLVIVHHLGKDPTKGARGHSSIEGAVDTIATIWLDGSPASTTPRTFTATGRRGVDVPPGTLKLEDGRLTLGDDPRVNRLQAQNRADDDAAWKLTEEHPGLSTDALGKLDKTIRNNLSRSRMERAIKRLQDTNRVTNRGTAGATKWHAVSGVDAMLTPDQVAAQS